ncbi:dihydrodipicolinate synthase family protein [Roseomonas sp. GC11]|uniref:dihydrodipicolinate synthase family protein n=1 Tax=Roseomonas sp. GC11 TaxID=2950546 RepID=UPI00210AA7E3|nr:dihydrodipicolinate synthase family protein [Roseomonas sp. GC11]MCQ4161558.1 dihydrodipicolinate synthase family protein [Roseomonas sp. GC11]
MTASPARFGLSCALATPFTEAGQPDLPRLVAHARSVLARGCGSITVFGTTGEGPLLGLGERLRVLGALQGAGLDLRRQVVGGVIAASLEEAEGQARMLLENDARALLIAPSFYFKGVSEDGVFDWFAALFARLGGAARDVILYNIPSVTAVPMPLSLITRLRRAFPELIIGVKDSSGDWAYTEALLAEHRDLAILIGDERHLAEGVRRGGQGAISGLANIIPETLLPLALQGAGNEAVVGVVEAVLRHPVTPAVKALIAEQTGDAEWLRVLPPLRALGDAAITRLRAEVTQALAARAA